MMRSPNPPLGLSQPQPGSSEVDGSTARDAYRLFVGAGIDLHQVASRMEHLTFPSVRQRLRSQQMPAEVSAVAVCWGAEPVGLALGSKMQKGRVAEVLSLYVRRDHRGRGLSRVLLRGLERLLTRQDCRLLQLAYRSDWPARPIIERRLQQLGWDPPVTHLKLGKFNVLEGASAWRSSPLHRIPMPAAYEIGPWSEVVSAELSTLLEQEAQGTAEELAPLQEPATIETQTSLVLRHRKRIVGWLVTHRLDAGTIQYTRLHVDRAHQRLGRGLPLITAAIQRQIETGVPHGVFQVRADNPRMLRLVERRLRPYLVTWTESCRSRKELVAGIRQTGQRDQSDPCPPSGQARAPSSSDGN